ncbi:energy transducer TonB [Parapedobacter sp.]
MMYLVLANLYLCVFYGFYYLFLRRETFFQGNRIYLLTSLLLAFTLPLAEYAGFDDSVVYQYQLPMVELGGAASGPVAGEVGVAASPSSAVAYLPLLYRAGCGIAAFLVLLQVFATIRALRSGRAGQAFSFFGMIRVDHAAYGSYQMAHHERVHARQWHSADIVVMQVVKILNWFNPVIYLYERALRLQHEYIADGRTAANDQFAYAELLVSRAMGVSGPALVNPFSNSNLLKRRIAMLLRDKSPNRHGWRYVALLPVVAGMLVFSLACNHQGKAGGDTDSTEMLSSTAGTVDATAFKKALGMYVMYREEAIRNGTQGILAFTFEKTDGGTIENISFLNELGDGQEEEVRKALQLEHVQRAAPVGKSMAYIHFLLSNTEHTDTSTPSAPSGYNALGEIVIMGYQPPPPPRVQPAPRKSDQTSATTEKERFPEPTVVQVRVGENKPEAENKQEGEPKDLIFQSVEIDPKPPGGMRSFMQYIGDNYDYPQEAIEAGVNGIVQVAFVVERDGSLTDMKIIRDLKYGTGEAAIRVLQSSSKWSPGVQNGRPVRVAYTLPIRLNLQQ